MSTAFILWGCIELGLVAAEVLAPGVFLLWLGIAAGVVALVVLAFPGMPHLWQAALFVIASLALIPAYRHFFRGADAATDQPLLNRRAEQFIGQSYVLHTAIVRGNGRIQVGDALWTVTGPDLPAGARVRVIGADSMTLKVAPDP
jgi:membrane protein implicated in regulation of membrane protease activity